jgi:hypothetical protein
MGRIGAKCRKPLYNFGPRISFFAITKIPTLFNFLNTELIIDPFYCTLNMLAEFVRRICAVHVYTVQWMTKKG